MRSMIGLILVLAWAPFSGASQQDVPTTESAVVQLLEVQDQVAPDEILAYLPEGRILAIGHSGSKSLSGKPWSLMSAMTPTLRKAMVEAVPQRMVPIVVGVVPGLSLDEVSGALEARGGTVVWQDISGKVWRIGLKARALDLTNVVSGLIAFDGRVVFADVQPGARLQNSRSAPLCQAGDSVSTPFFDKGILGQDQIICVMDTGIDADHCFFDDPGHGLPATNDRFGTEVDLDHRKLLAVNFWWAADWPRPNGFDWDSQGHGTHVAGSVAGDTDAWGTHQGNDGMAPAARLVIQDGGYQVDECADLPGLGCPVRPLEPMLEQAWAQGARIHSNSWGDAEESWPLNRYTEPTADIDRFIWEHPTMLVVAAAGNAGGAGDNTVISPSTGKNVLSVGAVGPADLLPICPSYFSSRGWTHDRRIKPEVMTPGTGVVSAASNMLVGTPSCRVEGKSGTSMATPTASGLAALVRQYFMEGWHVFGRRDLDRGFEPTAALIKAVMVASAVDLRTRGCIEIDYVPSRGQGWGLVELDQALWFEGDDHRLWVTDRLEAFESETDEDVVVIDLDQPAKLKVVLAWTDVPSSSTADVNLVNDLNLVVEGPGGEYFGNHLIGGRSVSGGSPDQLNNVEVVLLPEAETGQWVVRIEAHALSASPQGYSLAIVGGEGVTRVPEPRNPQGGRSVP